ncbi:MAG: glycosyltransferase family 4 protein [Algibacter sp.]
MNFLIVTNAPTLKKESNYFSYAPYVNEINIWLKYADQFAVLSPTVYNQELLVSNFSKTPKLFSIPSLSFNSIPKAVKSVFYIPIILIKLYKAMVWADHIHLRCPGNIGLLGCFIQMFFPKKNKTAKYAGNWDPKAQQPLSYKLQKWILKNTFFTRNIQVLVYGNWRNQTRNIKPFFTATYSDSEKEKLNIRTYKGDLNFIFVGSLVKGKRPLLAVKIIKELNKKNRRVYLDLYGDGVLKDEIQNYITNNKLDEFIRLHGNQPKKKLKEALKKADFSLLLSKSEGWPKAVAEAMFFGVIPIATSVSCVPFMLDNGNRGLLVQPNLQNAVFEIHKVLKNNVLMQKMSFRALEWSQRYTLSRFETEIALLLKA